MALFSRRKEIAELRYEIGNLRLSRACVRAELAGYKAKGEQLQAKNDQLAAVNKHLLEDNARLRQSLALVLNRACAADLLIEAYRASVITTSHYEHLRRLSGAYEKAKLEGASV